MKLSKKTQFYYLDYLQKQLEQVVSGHKLSLGTLDQMLYMILELKKETVIIHDNRLEFKEDK